MLLDVLYCIGNLGWKEMERVITRIWWRGALTCGSHVAINVHGDYLNMVEGNPYVWLMCTVITTTRWWRWANMCGSCVAINVHGNYYCMVDGSPHVWQLTCMVITRIWWRGALMCGSCELLENGGGDPSHVGN